MSVTSFHLRLEQELLDRLRSEKPKYVSLSGFCSILFEEALTARANVAAYSVGAENTPIFRSVTPSLNSTSPERETQELRNEATAVSSNGCSEKDFSTSLLKNTYLGKSENPLTSPKPKAVDPYSSRTLRSDLIPEDLAHASDDIIDFWSVKKGTRSQNAASRLFERLRSMTPTDQQEALHAAYDAQWATVYPPQTGRQPNRPQRQQKGLVEQAREMGLI
jgi:hypothetical protein